MIKLQNVKILIFVVIRQCDIDCNTRKIAEDGWTGITKGESEGIGTGISLPKGFSLNLGLQITVYRDPDKPNNDFSDNPEWFYSCGRVEYPAPWGGIRVCNPDCNTF